MRTSFLIPLAAAIGTLTATTAIAQDAPSEANEVDYASFEVLTEKVATIRQDRLLRIEQFAAKAAASDTLILDTRSVAAFERGHIEGAVNLPFSDFTQEALAEVVGANKGRTILIYCSNNFRENMPPIPLKKAPLALNIPTFINLIGYGYTNVWELGETVSVTDVEWVGTHADELKQLAATMTGEKTALAN